MGTQTLRVLAFLSCAMVAGAAVQAAHLSGGTADASGQASAVSIDWWTTAGQGTDALSPGVGTAFGQDRRVEGAVTLDPVTRQTVTGVGAALTESSAVLLAGLAPAARADALRLLFDPTTGAGIDLLRIPLGASDFALGDYTYDDVAPGATDPHLERFSIDRERRYVLPVLAEALAINRRIQVVLTPWSAPAWMKVSGTTHGGRLDPAHESIYADYLVRGVSEFLSAGAPVTALTLANEPRHDSAGYPSMLVDVDQQQRLAIGVRQRLDSAGLEHVGLLAHDHNWEDADAARALLTGPAASAYRGAAFHCYGGDVGAQAEVAAAAPGAEIWTTECSGGDWSASAAGDLRWGARNVLIGGFRNGSTAVLWWNLALDPSGGPTNGGCLGCRGLLTVDPTTGAVTPAVEHLLVAHAGRFLPPGSVRLGTPGRTVAGIESVAFRTPHGRYVLLLLNDGAADEKVTVRWDGRAAHVPVPAGALVTATWGP